MSACTPGVSRRSFVQGAGLAAAGAAALAGTALPRQAHAVNVNPDDVAWDYEADVVVLGFGVAGATTATTVERAGSSVIVVERDEFDNRLSNTRMSGGLIHCPDADHDPEALKQYLRCMFSGDILPGMTEGEYSPLFIEEMVEKFAALEPGLLDFVTSLDDDIQFNMFGGAAFPTFPGAEQSGYRVYAPMYDVENSGLALHGNFMDKYETAWGESLMRAFENELIDNELVQFLWGHYGEQLIQAPSGEVIGLVALKGGPEGEPVYIKAKKAVMLSSGGYEYSEELRRAFIEGPAVTGWTFYGTPSNTGQGIVMGLEAGAQMLKASKASCRMILACPDVLYNGLRFGLNCDASVGTEGTYIVNAHGNRFIDETKFTKDPSRYFSYKEAVHMDISNLEYPNIPAYLIFDDNRRQKGALASEAWGLIPFEWDALNENAVEAGWILKADTLEELAQKILETEDNKGRMSAENLVAANEQYNQACETGVDEAFGRVPKKSTNSYTGDENGWTKCETGPFYAMPLVAGGPNTKGGLLTDANRNVVDWKNQPIPRLYSAGEMSSCFKWVYQSGGNITEGLVCGQIAGEAMAAEEPWC